MLQDSSIRKVLLSHQGDGKMLPQSLEVSNFQESCKFQQRTPICFLPKPYSNFNNCPMMLFSGKHQVHDHMCCNQVLRFSCLLQSELNQEGRKKGGRRGGRVGLDVYRTLCFLDIKVSEQENLGNIAKTEKKLLSDPLHQISILHSWTNPSFFVL